MSVAVDAVPWSGAQSWHVLDLSERAVARFVQWWHAWRTSSQRPDRLWFSIVAAQPTHAAALLQGVGDDPALQRLAQQLAPHGYGWVEGTHRIGLDHERVQLTVHIGTVDRVLPTLDVAVDTVYAGLSSGDWARRIGRLCRTGTRLVLPSQAAGAFHDWRSAGFEPCTPIAHLPSQADDWHAVYAPHWTVRPRLRQPAHPGHRRAVVVGAGLAGSSVAYSLACRGWSVTVIDQGAHPAAGASGLPAGIVAPHVSADDAPLSRLSRSGVRLTLQRAATLLCAGTDWAPTGVLAQCTEAAALPPLAAWASGWMDDWTRPATEDERAWSAPARHPAWWHSHAGWIRPHALVQAQLAHPAIACQGSQRVHGLRRHPNGWTVADAQGRTLADAPLLVLAAGFDTRQLLHSGSVAGPLPPLHALRGQVTWGPMSALPDDTRRLLPPFPVNGHGALVHSVPGPDGEPSWVLGSTFERGMAEAVIRSDDRAANLAKLQTLLPRVGQAMAPHVTQGNDWAGVRCTLPDRLPAVGYLDPVALPGLALCTGLGARGLTLSVLCGEWLAALLDGEPWPTERVLADKLSAQRWRNSAA